MSDVRKSSDVKSRMSFTDLIPNINLKASDWFGFKSKGNALANYLSPDPSQNLMDELADWAESIDFLINLIKNPIISLFINPQSITVNKQVLLNKQPTRGGFVIQFWGHDLETISVKAETGYFGMSKVPLRVFDLFKDYCYQKRYHHSKPFKAIPLITMLYENQALQGYFNSLNYTIVQSRPYIITYDFQFTVTKKISIPILSTITNITNKFRPESDPIIPEKYGFAKGWGVKLY